MGHDGILSVRLPGVAQVRWDKVKVVVGRGGFIRARVWGGVARVP
jgi:hypothetical protein